MTLNLGSSTFMFSKRLIVSLVLLVSMCCFTHSLVAQTENECPLPPDTEPVEDPEVTAQQVAADGSELGNFTRLVRDRLKNYSLTVTSMAQIAYFGCVLREEGGPWRTDSVYPILLTPFGRVVFHTKDMSLSGRLLDPNILGTIYAALGVSRSDIADLRSTDPNTVASARRAILATLAEERDASFDATTPIPGVRPGIPGASGHAAVWVGRTFRIPLIALVGFDLSARHVVDEVIDYGNPTITAQDVVDRDTLKQFVTEAGNFFVSAQEQSGDGLIGSIVKVAMRDPNGPWRHGSVYIYVLDLRSNIIFIHGANPNRYEFRPLIPVARDAITGEWILPQVIEAAQSGPEGGYLRYYFDDPTDDTDSADIPKVGYAREFFGSIQRADGGVIQTHYIVGSGFYLTDPAVVALRQNNVVETVLPQVMRTMTASTVDAISNRIQQATNSADTSPSTVFTLGGSTNFTNALFAGKRGVFDANNLFNGSSFILPLNASLNGKGRLSNLTFWGNADYRSLSDDNLLVMTYDGNVTSTNLGFDGEIGENLIGGVSLTIANGVVDYTDPELVKGEVATSLTSINPYFGWRLTENAHLWGAAGFGWGTVEFEESTNSQSSDLSQTMVEAGVNLSLWSSEQLIGGGTTSLQLQGETALTRAEIDEGSSLENRELDASRHRVMFEGTYTRKFESDSVFTPSITAGWRNDGGDGETGSGFEIGAGLGYTFGRLAVQLDSQSLLTHSEADDYADWSMSGMVSLLPSTNGHGLSMSIGSSLGLSHPDHDVYPSGSIQDARVQTGREAPVNPSPWIHAKVRYDFNKPNGLGLWSSFGGTKNDNQYRVLQLGLQFHSNYGFKAGLELGHQESLQRSANHSIAVRGSLRW